jgi:hypothetical protein
MEHCSIVTCRIAGFLSVNVQNDDIHIPHTVKVETDMN